MLNPNNYEDVVAGQRVIDWLLKDDATMARRMGIMYVIWNRRIWATYRSQDGWRHYAGPDPHYSHSHFSFGWSGAEMRTSWWSGRGAPVEYGPCRKYIEDPMPKYGDTINLKPCPKPKHKPKPPKVYEGIPSPAAAKPWFHSNAPIVKNGSGKHRADSFGPASTSGDPEANSTPVADPNNVAPTPSNADNVDRSPAVAPANGPTEPGD
jgi:hypothetical protein